MSPSAAPDEKQSPAARHEAIMADVNFFFIKTILSFILNFKGFFHLYFTIKQEFVNRKIFI